jgi:hypothetical protein
MTQEERTAIIESLRKLDRVYIEDYLYSDEALADPKLRQAVEELCT